MNDPFRLCLGNESNSMFLDSEVLLSLELPISDELKYILLPSENSSLGLAKPSAINGGFVPLAHLTPASDNCDWLRRLSSRDQPFTHLVQTCILPFSLALTIIINTLLCITLNRPTMQTPTNFLLLVISLADLFTGLLPLPIFVAFLTDDFDKNLTIGKAFVTYYCTVVLPTLFHTISIWLTVLLAIQRFIYVVKPLSVRKHAICRYRGVSTSVVIVVILALLYNVNNFLTTFNAGAVVCTDSLGTITKVHAKLFKCTPLKAPIQFAILLLRAFTVHITPCLLLCILTANMMAALRDIARKRNELLRKRNEIKILADKVRSKDLPTESRENKTRDRTRRRKASNGDAYKTSRIMLVVLLLFLVVEIPTTVLVVMYSLLLAFRATPPPFFAEVREVCNLLIVFSYPCNFVIYFAMSKQFRIAFASLIPDWSTRRQEHRKK
ncbi:sex peptide receptor [Echinococcus multilocularis]|uniref:Sex peptide receptor n=1 Tax=Echinococcus multilocularis TaxID=6211 RepID=A0A068YD28_ECHMU|nr:sex peptide receptor [Echinococcus multilocularis]